MTSRRYRDSGDSHYQIREERSTRPNKGIQDFTTGQETINREKMENRREIVDKTKEAINELKDSNSIIDAISDIIKGEQHFRLSKGNKGSTETYRILGDLERSIRRKKNIDWNSITIAAERNGDLTEALYDISQEIPDLTPINQIDSSAAEYMLIYTPQNRMADNNQLASDSLFYPSQKITENFYNESITYANQGIKKDLERLSPEVNAERLVSEVWDNQATKPTYNDFLVAAKRANKSDANAGKALSNFAKAVERYTRGQTDEFKESRKRLVEAIKENELLEKELKEIKKFLEDKKSKEKNIEAQETTYWNQEKANIAFSSYIKHRINSKVNTLQESAIKEIQQHPPTEEDFNNFSNVPLSIYSEHTKNLSAYNRETAAKVALSDFLGHILEASNMKSTFIQDTPINQPFIQREGTRNSTYWSEEVSEKGPYFRLREFAEQAIEAYKAKNPSKKDLLKRVVEQNPMTDEQDRQILVEFIRNKGILDKKAIAAIKTLVKKASEPRTETMQESI